MPVENGLLVDVLVLVLESVFVAVLVAETVVEVLVVFTRLAPVAPHCFPEKQRFAQSWLFPQLLAQACLLCMHRLYGMVKEYSVMFGVIPPAQIHT